MLKGICTTVAAPLLSVVTGTVQDASTGEAVIGAAVILQNTTYGAVADAKVDPNASITVLRY